MINYFTLDNYRKHFSVVIKNNNVTIFRIEIRDKIWEGLVKDIFIGKSCLNEMNEYSGARDDSKWDGNTIFLELEEKNNCLLEIVGCILLKQKIKLLNLHLM